jgi:hypothetical protein
MDPNFGDPRLRDMLDGAAKTSQFTAQINLAMALAMQPFQNFLQRVSMVSPLSLSDSFLAYPLASASPSPRSTCTST